MEKKDRAAQRAETLALAGLVKYVGLMLLIAGILGMLLGGYVYDKDAKTRRAMGRAEATVTGKYVHGGSYYIVYAADGSLHRSLLPYDGDLNDGDKVDILYDREWYGNVRTPEPESAPLLVLGSSAIGTALGIAAMYGQYHLKGKDYNPWNDEG